MEAGRLDSAEAGFREALALHVADHGSVSTRTSDVLIELGVLLHRQGRLRDADSLLSEGLAQRRRLLGSDHRFTATALNNLANVRRDLGDLAGADTLLHEALAIHRAAGFTGHDDHLRVQLSMVGLLLRQERVDSAERLGRDNLRRAEDRGERSAETARRAQVQLEKILALRGRDVGVR
jgi:hypothetical protein